MKRFLFELNRISKYRSALMGLSIFCVYMFHSNPSSENLISITRYGWLGVDVFIFLSALGCCYSLQKNNNILEFYKRRIMRILPTWYGVLILFNIVNTLAGRPSPHTFIEGILYYSGLGFWVHGLFDSPMNVYYEWYVPTLLLFYFFIPYLFRCKKVVLYILFLVSAFITSVLTFYNVAPDFSLSYQRVPICLLGVIVYRLCNNAANISGESMNVQKSLVVSFIIGVALVAMNSISLPEEFTWFRLGIIFCLPMALLLICNVIEHLKLNGILSFLGIISFEIYLLHIYWNSPLLRARIFPFFSDGVAILVLFALVVVVGYVYSKIIQRISSVCIGK